MQEFKTDISLNGNQAKNIIIDPKDNFPPISESYEGRKITLNGISYIFHNGAWQSVAEDLEGRNESHEEIFVFQTTANDLSVKDGFAKIKKIKGFSFFWNQLFGLKFSDLGTGSYKSKTILPNGNLVLTSSSTNNQIYSYCNFIMPKAFQKGHKVLVLFTITNVTYTDYMIANDIYLRFWAKFGINSSTATMRPEPLNKGVIGVINTVETTGNTFQFGTSAFQNDKGIICKEIYSYEFSNINVIDLTVLFGEGNEPLTVAEFLRFFPNGNYPYNAGELISFNASKLKTVGFNAFNGTEAKVLGGQTYYLGGEYSSLGFTENLDSEVIAFDLPADRLYTPVSNGYIVASGNNICINLSHTGFRNGEYLPYMNYSLSFDFIKSIKDSNNNLLFADGDLCSVGKFADEIYTISDKHCKAIKRIGKRAYQSGDENLENTITDKTNTLYILDTPIESVVFEKELSYFEWDFGTEEIISDEYPIVPIRADVQYIFNAVDMIRNNYYLILEILKRLPKNITLDFWSLTQANAETSACEVTINNSNESIFPKVLATYGDYIHSRNIFVDLSNYSDASSYVFDLFGDITNVPINVRYSIFITGYNDSLKLDFPKQYLTNISATHTPDGTSEEKYTIAYSSATKIDFVKLGANKVWVDVSNKM